MALAGVEKVEYPKTATSKLTRHPAITDNAPDFVKEVLGAVAVQKGDDLPVSKIPDDGTFPIATTQYEKRGIAEHIPIWKSDLCIQCGQCTVVCPHACIRMKSYDSSLLKTAPSSFKSCAYKGKEMQNASFTIQVSPED